MVRPANDKHFDHQHEYSRAEGYKPAEYEHQEYPKIVRYSEGDQVFEQRVENADEEAAFYQEHPQGE